MVWFCLHYYSPAVLQTREENTLQAVNIAQNQSGPRKKILPWTEQSGGSREKEGHDASSAQRSGSSFLSSFAVY